MTQAKHSDLVFWCSECEGHHFESIVNAKGRCQGCGHEWHRDQDYAYFVEVRRFTSLGEFRIYLARDERRRTILKAIAVGLLFLAAMAIVWGSVKP